MAPPTFLTYTDVTLDDARALKATTAKQVMRAILSKSMKVDAEEGVAAEILLEFHLQNYLFAVQHRTLNVPEKISTWLSTMRIVYEDAIGERKQMFNSFSQLRELLHVHAKQVPPYTVGVFSPEEVGELVDYASKTFFRHYRMYQYVYQKRRELELRVQTEDLAPPVIQAYPLSIGQAVDPKEQPELAYLFAGQTRTVPAMVQPSPKRTSDRPLPPEAKEANVKLEGALGAFDTALKASDEALDALMQSSAAAAGS